MTPYAPFVRTAAVSLSLVCAASAAAADAIVIPIADSFDVAADGAPTVLDILSNDIDYNPAAPPVTRVTAPLACGLVEINAARRAVVSIAPECPDAIKFDYCVDTEIGCLDAVVTLRVVSRPEIAPETTVEPVVEVAAAPVEETQQAAEPVVEVAAALVEETRQTVEPVVEIAAAPVEEIEQTVEPVVEVAAAPVEETQQAAEPVVEVAAAPVEEIEQTAEPVVEVAAAPVEETRQTVEPVVEVAAAPIEETQQTAEPVVEIAAAPIEETQQTAEPVVEIAAAPQRVVAPIEASTVSIRSMRAAPAPAERAAPIEVDPVLRAQIAAALAEDDSVDCGVAATVVARPGGFNLLEAHSPCRAGEPILIMFDGLRYAAPLDADGRGEVELFSLTPQSTAVIHTADGAQVAVEVIAVGLRGQDRVIVAWESFWNAELTLAASTDSAWSLTDTAMAQNDAGGQPKMVLDMSSDAPTALRVTAQGAPCGARVSYRLLRSVDGDVRQDVRRTAGAADCVAAVPEVRLAGR